MSFLGSLVCKLRGAHKFRRAQKHEPVGHKVCVRCGVNALVKPRKRKANGGTA